MRELKQRYLAYRRVSWFGEHDPKRTFEAILNDCLKQLSKIEENRIKLPDGTFTEIRHHQNGPDLGIHLHIVRYTPDDRATIVPIVDIATEADLDTVGAPDGTEFMDGDIMVKIKGDDVLFCQSGLREGQCVTYFRALFDRGGFEEESIIFDILPAADMKTVNLIAEDGVRKISLGVSLYAETLGEVERRTATRTLRNDMTEWLMALIEKDAGPDELAEAENLQAKVIISYDGRKKGGALGKEHLVAAASEILKDDEGGFVIETMSGSRIGVDNISMKQKVNFEGFGKSISYLEGWAKLEQYYEHLDEMGALEF